MTVNEVLFRKGHQTLRPFSNSAAITCRSYSLPLQRVVTDFAADLPYARTSIKVKEHYGINLSASSIRQTTMIHAQALYENENLTISPNSCQDVKTIIAEMDGCMVPIVEINEENDDRRKGKALVWKELKLCLAHPVGSNDPFFGGTFSGGVNTAGKQLHHCAKLAGFGEDTQLHAVGDGAKWIADQVGEQFGVNGSYLIDFFHLCDYLSEAAPNNEEVEGSWYKEQKALLKAGQAKQVIDHLRTRIEPDEEGPVYKCYRYMTNRKEQLFYKNALKKKLPIGSGEIESAHRYVIQHRFKLAGAWWKSDNIDYMLSLQLNRANRFWDNYWDNLANIAA